jgi:hypothetical protein
MPRASTQAGRSFTSNLIIHDGVMLRGEGLNHTMLCPTPGTKGSWLKNTTGQASKITIERIRFYGCGELGITAGIDLGSPPGIEWGDYSDLRDIEVSNLPNAIGIKLQVNVSVMYNVRASRIQQAILALIQPQTKKHECTCIVLTRTRTEQVWTEQTHDGILNEDGGCCLMAFGCGAMAFKGVGIKLQIADYWSGVEIEAPLDGSTPVEIQARSHTCTYIHPRCMCLC